MLSVFILLIDGAPIYAHSCASEVYILTGKMCRDSVVDVNYKYTKICGYVFMQMYHR